MITERIRFYLKHSFNDLMVNRLRTAFGVMCIATGVAVVVALLTLSDMVRGSLTSSLQESNRGDIRITYDFGAEFQENAEADDTRGVVSDEEGSRVFTEQGLNQIINWFEDNYGDQVTITYRQSGENQASVVASESYSFIVSPFIVDTSAYPLYGEVETDDGQSLQNLINPASYDPQDDQPADIVISENMANDFDVGVGDRLTIQGVEKPFVVRGIVPTRSESGFQNLLAGLVGYYYVDLDARQLFDDMDVGVSEIYVRLEDPDRVDEIDEALEEEDAFFFRGTNTSFLQSTTTTDLEENNELISDAFRQFSSVLGLLSILLGGIGIVNTMLVIVQRRTTEVAILKTLGLNPREITYLFIVESFIMGLLGSLVGIPFGLGLALFFKQFAETFVAQDIAFVVTLTPILTGLIVGVLMTTIFGFVPTLAASQVRPASVLRPQEAVILRAGRLQSFVALLVVILALSLVSQGLLNDLFTGDQTSILRIISTIAGGIFGLMIGASIVAGGMFYHWAKNNILLRMLRWGLFLGLIPVALAIFGNFVPALIILIGTFITVGILYAVLWGVIWAAGGGSLADFLPGGLVFLVPIFWPFIPLIVVVWLLGQVIQRVTFVDMKIAMRSMLATKARGASMLLALVIGVFTLSFLVMLVTTFRDRLEELLIDQAGGNVFVFLFSEDPEADVALERALTTVDGVNSYTLINSYQTELAHFTDVSEEDDVVNANVIRQRLDEELGEDVDYDEEIISTLDGRGIESNLPSGDFDQGRQLRTSDLDREIPAMVIPDDEFTQAAGFEVGDIVTLYIISNADERVRTNPIDFEIVGMRGEPEGLNAELAASDFYVPRESLLAAIEANSFPGEVITAEQRFAVADVDEDSISELREEIGLTFAFVFETRLFFDLINRIIDQFTTWPIIVTGTALLTGFIVIANAVALTTMERRREIAIMKAVGLARWRVLGMLILENTLIGLIGGLIGVGMAAFLLFLTLSILFEGVFGEAIPYTTALGLMLMCVGITIIAALLSVWNASGEKPLNVLRYE